MTRRTSLRTGRAEREGLGERKDIVVASWHFSTALRLVDIDSGLKRVTSGSDILMCSRRAVDGLWNGCVGTEEAR